MNNNKKKPYNMYVLNLDAGRVFWLAIILVLLLILAFLSGYLIGKKRALKEISSLEEQGKLAVEKVLNSDEDLSEYEFYNLSLNSQKEKNLPSSPEKYNQEKILEEKPEVYKDTEKNEEKEIFKRLTEKTTPSDTCEKYKSISKEREVIKNKATLFREFYVQVASCRDKSNAYSIRNKLVREEYPVVINKSVVNGKVFYRVKVGPFKSLTLARKVLAMLKAKKEYRNSFIVK